MQTLRRPLHATKTSGTQNVHRYLISIKEYLTISAKYSSSSKSNSTTFRVHMYFEAESIACIIKAIQYVALYATIFQLFWPVGNKSYSSETWQLCILHRGWLRDYCFFVSTNTVMWWGAPFQLDTWMPYVAGLTSHAPLHRCIQKYINFSL